jgi:hypothetical protein
MAEENPSWGYDRIVGALANLGHEVSDQTVGNVVQRHGLPPASDRKHTTTWAAFIRAHLALLAGTDFFTVEVLTLRGLVTYYVLFFIHLESRKVDIAGITVHPNEQWMQQIARNATMEGCGTLRDCHYLLHDRDTKFTISSRAIIVSGQVKPLALPAHSPNLNAYAERWVRSVKEECLSKVILFGERALRRALNEYVSHYHAERNHQGKGNDSAEFRQIFEDQHSMIGERDLAGLDPAHRSKPRANARQPGSRGGFWVWLYPLEPSAHAEGNHELRSGHWDWSCASPHNSFSTGDAAAQIVPALGRVGPVNRQRPLLPKLLPNSVARRGTETDEERSDTQKVSTDQVIVG